MTGQPTFPAFSRGTRMKPHNLPVSPANVHWGYFSKKVAPALTLRSGDRATIETLTHHANDDYERMIAGDPGAESVFHWTRDHKAVVRRGAGPTEGPFVRGSGEGVGVHLLTGPVAVEHAAPGALGISLSRFERAPEAAKSHPDLRTRHNRRAVRQGGLQLCLDAADGPG